MQVGVAVVYASSVTIQQRRCAMRTVQELRAWFSYNPETGELRQLGRLAGYVMRTGYRLLSVKKQRIYAHRLIWCLMTGDWPEREIDHINGCKSDNRWCNLRLATRQENARNQSVRTTSKSGYKGVSFHTRVGRWRAVIETDLGHRHLGYFDTKEQASCMYQQAATTYFGQFARPV